MTGRKRNSVINVNTQDIDTNLVEQERQTVFVPSRRLLQKIQCVVQSAVADTSLPQVLLLHLLRQPLGLETLEVIDSSLLSHRLRRTRSKCLAIHRRCRTRGWILHGWARLSSKSIAVHNIRKVSNNYKPIMKWMRRWNFSAHRKIRNVEDSTTKLKDITTNHHVATHQHPQ
jgi:hypothetical protein